MKSRFIAPRAQPILRLVPLRIRRMTPTANNEHRHDGVLLVPETLFDERDQAFRAEEVVESGTKVVHVRDV